MRRYGQVQSRKAQDTEIDYISRSSVHLLNHQKSEAMHNVSAHQPQWLYQSPTSVSHGLNFFWLHDIRPVSYHEPKHDKTFDSP